MNKLKRFESLVKPVVGACLALGAMGAQAAPVSVTFPTTFITPTVNTQINGTAYQELTAGGSLSGFGRISTLNGNLIFGNSNPAKDLCATNCVLTYQYSGFNFAGQDANKFYFTGLGQLNLFVNFGTTAPTVPSFQNAPATAFANAKGTYDDGFLLLSATAHSQGNVTVPGQLVFQGAGNSTARNAAEAQCDATPGQVFSISGSSPNFTWTCNTTGSTISNVTLAVSKLTVGQAIGVGSGFAYFDAVGGIAKANFDHDTQLFSSDIVTEVSFNNGTGCTPTSPTTPPQYCTGTVLSSAFIQPATVALIPEPGSLALAGLSLVALGAIRRRKAVSAA